jgi:hypothetical protein
MDAWPFLTHLAQRLGQYPSMDGVADVADAQPARLAPAQSAAG